MSESQRIADQVQRACFGLAWHGPSVQEVLEAVTAEQAAAYPIEGGHSIGEVVLHITAWMREARETIQGKPYETLKGDRDWPPAGEISSDQWMNIKDALRAEAEQLVDAIQKFPAEKLGEGDRSPYYLLHGIVQHNLYHAGQIALLKRAGRLI